MNAGVQSGKVIRPEYSLADGNMYNNNNIIYDYLVIYDVR